MNMVLPKDHYYWQITDGRRDRTSRLLDVTTVACRHASPDDTRAGRLRAGHVNLTFAARGQWGLWRACLASRQSS